MLEPAVELTWQAHCLVERLFRAYDDALPGSVQHKRIKRALRSAIARWKRRERRIR